MGRQRVGIDRPVAVRRDERLRRGREQELEVRLGHRGSPLARHVGIDPGDVRLGQDAGGRVKDLQVPSGVVDLPQRLILPGQVDVSELLVGEGGGGAARPLGQGAGVAVELGNERLRPFVVAAGSEHRAPGAQEGQLAVAGGAVDPA